MKMPTPDSQKRRILVVDDDQSVSDSIERILKDAGYEVKTANSGVEALAVLEHSAFDLIIVDYLMPAMTGDRVATAIKARMADQRILMITAYKEMLKSSGASLGSVDRFMCKPFPVSELLDNVAAILQERGSRESAKSSPSAKQ